MDWDELDWHKEKQRFGGVAFGALVFTIISFFGTPVYEYSELESLDLHYSSHRQVRNTGSDRFEVKFKEKKDRFNIHRIEKEYLDQKLFKKIKRGDKVRVYVAGDDIQTLVHRGRKVLNKEKADSHKNRSRYFTILVSILWFVLLITPTFYTTQPFFTVFNKRVEIRMNWVYITFLIVLTLLIIFVFGGPNP